MKGVAVALAFLAGISWLAGGQDDKAAQAVSSHEPAGPVHVESIQAKPEVRTESGSSTETVPSQSHSRVNDPPPANDPLTETTAPS